MKKNKGKIKTGMSYEQERDLQMQKRVRNIAIVLAVIMGLTLVSWSMLGYGNVGGAGNSNRNIAYMDQAFQNAQTGEVYAGAYLEGTRFIFYESIEDFKFDTELEAMADQLKNSGLIVQEFVDQDFIDDRSRLFISQGLRVNNVQTIPTQDLSCENPTLIFTTNSSSLNISDSPNCIVFDKDINSSFRYANGLTYHLIKDLS